ncbi:MAG: hypothetical protein A2219_06920 [Elusimicrobia bacterium RIFOXYA2_FULL_50_26]|nr:MAG: hypothetical protein A2219_06920 [Elusimicrobia bacterium RIFOXYA2_FULL_50_26]
MLLTADSFGATLFIQDNFEEGASWDYNTNWAYPDQADEWDIVPVNPHGGTYCAQSKIPGGGPFDDSKFNTDISTGQNEVFVRFWFKASPNLTCDWAQFLRFKNDSNNDLEIGPSGYQTAEPRTGSACGTIVVSESDADLFTGIYQDSGLGNPFIETSWTEYAFYLNYSENKLYFWRNAIQYTTSDPGFNEITGVSYGSWRMSHLMFPMYYKSFWTPTEGQDELFWIDDIEIWYGCAPDETPVAPPDDVNHSPSTPTNLRITTY